MSLSTHVLDATTGRPAIGMAVRLERGAGGTLASSVTDADGRIRDWGGTGVDEPGNYRLVFDSVAYFAARGIGTFYPEVAVTFAVGDPSEHYHVPLLLSPYAYSTYRGS